MKRTLFIIFIIISVIGGSSLNKSKNLKHALLSEKVVSPKVNLIKMDKTERDKWIADKAKEMVIKYFPGYFKDVMPFIVQDTVHEGRNAGVIYFKAYFPARDEKELTYFEYFNASGEGFKRASYSAEVDIWGDTGEVILVENGDLFIVLIDTIRAEEMAISTEESTSQSTSSFEGSTNTEQSTNPVDAKSMEISSAMEFIAKHLVYPETSKENGIQGVVLVSFTVEKNGTITNSRVTESLDAACDAEALRIVRSMPKWKPDTINGQPVRVQHVIPVRFKLNTTR